MILVGRVFFDEKKKKLEKIEKKKLRTRITHSVVYRKIKRPPNAKNENKKHKDWIMKDMNKY